MEVGIEARLTFVAGNVTPDQFVHWLRGYLDATGGKLSPEQVAEVQAKLRTVIESPLPLINPDPVAKPWNPSGDWLTITCGAPGACSESP